MSEPLGVDQVREMLREIVAEFPEDYCYQQVPWQGSTSCVYSVDGCPSCLIGHLLHRLNITVPEWHQRKPIAFVAQRHVAAGVFTDGAVSYMQNVQQAQDSGMPWVKCLRFADNVELDRTRYGRSADADPKATV